MLCAVPFYTVCGFTHVCMAGHMQHGPYPTWGYVSDSVWLAGFVVAEVLVIGSCMRWKKAFVALIPFLAVLRLAASDGLFDSLLALCLAFIALANLFPSRIPD